MHFSGVVLILISMILINSIFFDMKVEACEGTKDNADCKSSCLGKGGYNGHCIDYNCVCYYRGK
nr:putative venom toxin Tcis30 [Tityus cisandinus]